MSEDKDLEELESALLKIDGYDPELMEALFIDPDGLTKEEREEWDNIT